MKNTTIALLAVLLCGTVASRAQSNGKPAQQPTPKYLYKELDPLGRRYSSIIGVLPVAVAPGINPEIANQFDLSCLKVVAGNAYRPYGVVGKSKLDAAKDVAKYLDKKQLKKYFYWEAVGCEYLFQVDLSNVGAAVSYDSFRNERPREKKIHHFFLNATTTVIDVATAKIMSVQNFTAQTDSRIVAPPPPASDSARALLKLYSAAAEQINSRRLSALLSGVGVVMSIEEKKEGKAETIFANANRLMNFSNYESEFDVYALRDSLASRGQVFWHCDRIGAVVKARDYDYRKYNFDVQWGGKAIAAAHKAGTVLICTRFQQLPPLSPLPPVGWRRSVAVDTFRNTTGALPPHRLRMFQDALVEGLLQWPQLLDIVDRASYRLVAAERAMQSLMKSDATQGSLDIGAEYLLVGEVSDYRETREKVPYIGPMRRAFDEIIRAEAQVDLRYVSVKTGEIAWAQSHKVAARRQYPFVGKGALDELRSLEMTKILADTFAQMYSRGVFERINGDAPLLKIAETDDSEAQRVLLGGGQWAGFQMGDRFEVVEETVEMVEGQNLLRETVIATLLAEEIFPQTTACKVKKGGSELLAKFNAGASLRCRWRK